MDKITEIVKVATEMVFLDMKIKATQDYINKLAEMKKRVDALRLSWEK